jgi:AcrR family transcriptional regulator
MAPEPTRRRIAHAARALLEAEGTGAVTMRRVAAAADITAMAVYRHYADRDALLNALANEGFEELTKMLDAMRLRRDFESRVKQVLDTNLDFALAHPRLFDLMFLQTRKGARRFPRDFVAGKSPTGNRSAELVDEGIRRGVFRKVDVWDVVFETGALLQGLVMLYLGQRMDATEQEFRAICHRAIGRYLDGIRKPKH